MKESNQRGILLCICKSENEEVASGTLKKGEINNTLTRETSVKEK